jgi:hypothetical protein
MFKLENWSVDASTGNGYLAPELRRPFLIGEIYGHPKFADGSMVRTSIIVSTTGRLVSTASGSVYELGNAHPDYAEWAAENGHTIDEEWPVKLLKTSRDMN